MPAKMSVRFRARRLLSGKMTISDTELLRRFVADRSELAFAELVSRHLDLVYSAALRQMNGDAGAAEDITQSVFTDLARKGGRLGGHTSLAGWLYTSTRYLTANARRAEHRRRQREQESFAMDQLLQPTEPTPNWDQLRPVLDDAMHELGKTDREAVLLRFFERRPLSEVGEHLGLGENAARMRVDRALDKLRLALARRGVTSTEAALTLALTAQAVGAAPADFANRVSQAAVTGSSAGAATGGGLFLSLLALVTRIPAKILVGAVMLALLVTPFIWPQFAPKRTDSEISRSPDISGTATEASAFAASVVPSEAAEISSANPTNDTSLGRLHLTLLTADNGLPVPGVLVERGWVTDAKFLSLRDGTVNVTYLKPSLEPHPVTRVDGGLRLTTRAEGFADTQLKWALERGEVVPETYTVRLERAVPIGGTVLDAEGNPVAGAKVGFNHTDDPGTSIRTENHEFGRIEVTTDEAGRWRINRIAEDMIRRLYGSAEHPEHVRSEMAFVRSAQAAPDSKTEAELRAGTFVFQLGRAVSATGMVVDSAGSPVADAKVSARRSNESYRREGTTGIDGGFTLRGCPPGALLLSAQAEGYSPTTVEVELLPDTAPFRLVLRKTEEVRLQVLRLRVVGHEGQPISGASVSLVTFAPMGAKPNLVTDSDGRAVWDEAPDAQLTINFSARGWRPVRGYSVHPDGQEYTVKMLPGLTISGIVRDAVTDKLIPEFRIIAGWPEPALDVTSGNLARSATPAWSSDERFWLTFGGGSFRHTFEESPIGVIDPEDDPGFVFRFEADGYAPFISRAVATGEGEARLEVALRPATDTTITVLTPDGRPAAAMEVALVSTGGHAVLTATGFNLAYNRNCILVTTDGRGRFQLPGDDSLIRVFAANYKGYGEATPRQLAAQPTWTMEAWGRIEGRIIEGDKPVSGRDVGVETLDGIAAGMLRLSFSDFRTETDQDGRFFFERIPPGSLKVRRYLRTDRGNGNVSWPPGHATDVEVRAGETTAVTLGTKGYQITGRLMLPPGLLSTGDWEFIGRVQTQQPRPPDEMKDNPAAIDQWLQSPEWQQHRKVAKLSLLSALSDGTLYGEGIEPGNYLVDCMAHVMDYKKGISIARAQAKPILITVPEEPATGTIDLGVITLSLSPSPKTP